MATSGYFNTDSVGNFYFTFEWYRTGYNSTLNEHYIHWSLTAHNTPGNYRTVYLRDLWIAGETRYWEDWGVRYYDGDVVASGDLTIASYNSAGDGWFDAGFDAGVGISSGSNCSGGANWDLDRIPRYTTVWNSERGKTINSISVNWSTSDNVDWVKYSLNDGTWTDAYGSGDSRSGYYTIFNLQRNTTYKVRTRCRRADSGLWSEAGNIWITTYNIATISTVPNIVHGNNLTVTYSNPSGSSLEIGVYKTDGITPIAGYRNCSGSSYTFNFTDEELDTLYKSYGNNESITLRVYIRTANNVSYTNYKEFTITLNGNQKTIRINKEDIWKRGQVYVKRNGAWKKGVIWINDNDVWKRGI